MNANEEQLKTALRNQVLQQENLNRVIGQMSGSLGTLGVFTDRLRVLVKEAPDDFYEKVKVLIEKLDKESSGDRTVNEKNRS